MTAEGKRERLRRLWLLAGPVVLLLAVESVAQGSVGSALDWVQSYTLAAVETALALFGLEVLLTALVGQLWLGELLLALPLLLLGTVSQIKEVINGTPLQLSDFAMAGDLKLLAGFIPTGFRVPEGIWFGWGLALALVAVLFFGEGHARSLRGLRPARERLEGGWLAFCLLLPLLLGCREAGMDRLELSQGERNASLGFLGGLTAALLSREGTEEYDTARLQALLQTEDGGMAAPSDGVQPHVIMVMSESFCDPDTALPGVSYQVDPIPNFHALGTEYPSGAFLSNTYAGGTGNVEMEVMTGLPSAFLRSGDELTTLDVGAYESLPSLAKVFAGAGYETCYVHNYTSRLYSRTEHMPDLGFDKVLFSDDFPADAPTSGPYLSDSALTEEILAQLDMSEGPLFLFAVSMENHQPYSEDKFSTPSGLGTESELLNDAARMQADVMAQGLSGADRALGELVAGLEERGEPVLLLFWGDHLPGLTFGLEDSAYVQLGVVPTPATLDWTAENMKTMHTTRYLVWNNYQAELSVPEMVSTNTLGHLTLKWAGVEPTAWFRWVEEATGTMLLYRSRLYVAADGTAYKEPPEEDRELVEEYRGLVRGMVYGDRQKE